MKLSQAQREYLNIIVSGRELSPLEIARLMGKPTSAVSNTRNTLLRLGMVSPWASWEDMPELTPAGRAALEAKS